MAAGAVRVRRGRRAHQRETPPIPPRHRLVAPVDGPARGAALDSGGFGRYLSGPQVWSEDLLSDPRRGDATCEQGRPDMAHEGQGPAREDLHVLG